MVGGRKGRKWKNLIPEESAAVTGEKLQTSEKERENTGLFVSDSTKLLEEVVKYCPGLETVILSEGELVVTGTEGYDYVPAPWWKTGYF